RVEQEAVIVDQLFALQRANALFAPQNREAVGVGGEERLVAQVEGDLGEVVFAVLQRQQDLAPPLLYFLARERRLQEGIKEQVEGVIDARGGEERTGEPQTIASGKAAQTTGQGFDRLGQLQARETLTAPGEQAGQHVIDTHVAFIFEQQPAEHHR